MTTKDTTEPHPTPTQETVLLNRFQSVIRTGRMKTTSRRQPARTMLIRTNHPHTYPYSYTSHTLNFDTIDRNSSTIDSPRSNAPGTFTTKTISHFSKSETIIRKTSRQRRRTTFLRARLPIPLEATTAKRPLPGKYTTRKDGVCNMRPSRNR